jgi:hypothetical protein
LYNTKEKKNSFFQRRDPDLEIFGQAFSMLIANLLGLFLWLILRFPCSMLIVLAPGIIVAIVFKETHISAIIKISFFTSAVISIFYIGTIMLHRQPIFQIVWVSLIIYFIFASYKIRYLASFALLPCSLAFHMPLGALSVSDRVVESFLSATLAIATVIIVKEFTAKYKVKRVLLLLILETTNLYNTKLTNKTGYNEKIKGLEIRIKTLTLKSAYLIKRYRYLQKRNRNFAQHASILLDVIIKISRAVTMLKSISSSNYLNSNANITQLSPSSKDRDKKTVLPNNTPYAEKEYFIDDLSLLQTIAINLNNIYISIASNNTVNLHKTNINKCLQEKLSFNNYFSLKNLVSDMENINNYHLQK